MAAVESTPNAPPIDRDAVRAARAAAETEQEWWTTHYAEYLAQYPEQFVAVKDGNVLTANADLQHLLAALARERIEPTSVWVRFITADPHRITL